MKAIFGSMVRTAVLTIGVVSAGLVCAGCKTAGQDLCSESCDRFESDRRLAQTFSGTGVQPEFGLRRTFQLTVLLQRSLQQIKA